MKRPRPEGSGAACAAGVESARRVLLVDDSADDAELMAISLDEAGLALEWRHAECAETLLRMLAGFIPELVICDLNLPGFSPQQAHLAVVAHTGAVPFVFVTGARLADVSPAVREALPPGCALLPKDDLPALARHALALLGAAAGGRGS